VSSSKATGAPVRWYRRQWLHLALGILVAILTIVWAGERAHQGVLDNLDSRLRDAGAGADAGLIGIEATQLATLRSIEFTNGIPQAVATRNAVALNTLVTPLQANSGVPMVDIVRPNGDVIFAVRSKGAPRPAASRAGLPAIKQAMAEARGPRGGRFSELVIFRRGPTFMTIGPLLVGKKPVGVALVMTPLADVLGRLQQEVRADLSAYTPNGIPLATTSVLNPPLVNPDDAHGLIGGGAVVYRSIHGSTREALGRLVIDHEAAAVLGVSLHDNSPATRTAVVLFAALGLIATVVLLATFWARFRRDTG
jgi:hypothetical protein